MTHAPSPLGVALHEAITRLRTTLADPVAPLALLVPASGNGVLARQQLALAGPYIRVEVLTPEQLVRDLGGRDLAMRGLRPQPAGWLRATVASLVRELTADDQLGRFGPTLTQPGWAAALARALDTLEGAGLAPADLRETHLPDHVDRTQLLGTLLAAVQRRRAADGLFAPAQLASAASQHVERRRWAGALVLGDRLLTPGSFDVIRRWLAARPHAEVQLHPWHRLDVAPSSLRAALASSAVAVPVAPPTPPALQHLARGLFAAEHPPGPSDDSVVFVRTPDDVRELGQATREVLRAVDGGVPLDQIAVVLPDADQVETLRGHLARAGVPATWLVGPPLTTTPAARFLTHLLALADGDDTVPSWYDLLRQPGLRLRKVVGHTEGRGRWRRILQRCGAVRTTTTITAAVRAWAAELDDEGFDPEGNRRAAGHLVAAMEAVDHELATLRTPATPGAHATRWAELLRRWWVASPDREQLLTVLASWGPAEAGGEVSLSVASAQLRDALAESSALQGTLMAPAVRVLTPMTLLGGAFARVVVTGLTEGRFPRRPTDDALLPDDLLEALAAHHGVALPTSRDIGAFETRRFAAVVGACTERLWLSAPATELLEGRPLLPSSWLLDAVSTQLGRRARYPDLAARQQLAGSRARPWPAHPDQAVDALEHRIAAAATSPIEGLRALIHHPSSRRLVALHRALAKGGRSAHTGQIPTDLLPFPALLGEPMSAWDLAMLLRDPSRYLAERLLGIRRLDPLEGRTGELDQRWRERALRRAVSEVPHDPRHDPTGILAAWDAAIQPWAAWRDDVSDEALAVARTQTELALATLQPALPTGQQAEAEGPVADGLPWVVRADRGWVDDGVFGQVHYKKPARRQLLRDAPEVVLAALAHGGLRELTIVATDGRSESQPVADLAAAVAAALQPVTAAVRDGWFPLASSSSPLHLAADPTFDLSAEAPE